MSGLGGGTGPAFGVLLEPGDVVHGTVEVRGLAGMRGAHGDPGLGREPAGLLRVTGLGEPAARTDHDTRQRVDDLRLAGGRGLSRHG